jgi:hypothetical protein
VPTNCLDSKCVDWLGCWKVILSIPSLYYLLLFKAVLHVRNCHILPFCILFDKLALPLIWESFLIKKEKKNQNYTKKNAEKAPPWTAMKPLKLVPFNQKLAGVADNYLKCAYTKHGINTSLIKDVITHGNLVFQSDPRENADLNLRLKYWMYRRPSSSFQFVWQILFSTDMCSIALDPNVCKV